MRRYRDREAACLDPRLYGEGSFIFLHFRNRIPDELSEYALIVHCGGCMLNEREMKYRLACAKDQRVPMTNYGILIAHVNGILKRSVEPFPEICRLLQG